MHQQQQNVHSYFSFLRRYVFLLVFFSGCTQSTSDTVSVSLPRLPQNTAEEALREQIRYLNEEITSRDEPPVVLYERRARLFLELHQENLALQDLKRVQQQDSTSAETTLGIARAYAMRQDTAEALQWGQRAEKLGSTAPSLWKLLGKLWLGRGDYTAAIRYLDRYRETYPESAEAFLWTGQAFHALGDTSEAMYRYRQALCYNESDSLPIYLDMIDLLTEHNEWLRARQLARIARSQTSAPWLDRYARIQWQLGKTDSALLLWRKAVTADSTFWPAQRWLGTYYFVRRVYSQAKPHLQKSLRYRPRDSEVALWLGHIAEYRDRNYAAALAYYQQAAQLDSLNVELPQRIRRVRWRQRQDSFRAAGVLPLRPPDSTRTEKEGEEE